MRGVERVGNLPGETRGCFHRHRAGERSALDELQNEVPRSNVVDLTGVGMIERGYCARFLLESIDAIGIAGELLWQHFDRDIATETRIARPVDDPHSACPERAGDLVGT
jgi:hypothetical protein